MRPYVSRFSYLHQIFWKIQPKLEKNPLVAAIYPLLFERRRLKLPVISTKDLSLRAESVELAGSSEEDWDMDTPLNDLVLILRLARSRQAKRILEVGTYRARSTYCFQLNCPLADIVSYDIQRIDSPYRQKLELLPNVDLRIGSFSDFSIDLKKGPLFDFIFIDGDHRYDGVLADSLLALSLLANDGVIIWHDYRHSTFFNPGLEVPEVVHLLAKDRPIYAVRNTACAIYVKPELRIGPQGVLRSEEVGHH